MVQCCKCKCELNKLTRKPYIIKRSFYCRHHALSILGYSYYNFGGYYISKITFEHLNGLDEYKILKQFEDKQDYTYKNKGSR